MSVQRLIAKQWAWERVVANAAWSSYIDRKRPPIKIAIVDSGIAHAHADLATFLLPEAAIPGITHTRDDEDHGTLLAGTICGVTNNVKTAASAPHVKILPIKFCGNQNPPNADAGAKAINMALEHGANVIVLAWDCGYRSAALDSAIDRAGTKRSVIGSGGAVIVAAAGNWAMDNDLHENWPARYGKTRTHVITVMATDRQDNPTSFSNWGKDSVFIAAPGVDVLSTVPYYNSLEPGSVVPVGYRLHNGTSAATAIVAGAVALLLAKNPGFTPYDVRTALQVSAKAAPSLVGLCETGKIVQY